MEAFKIAGTDDTPNIDFNPGGKFIVSGRSLPEDVKAFFGPVFAWLDEYQASGPGSTTFEFELEYFNTASSKMILDLLMKIEDMKGAGIDVKIIWYYDEDDEDMEEAGEEYEELVDVPFELKILD